MEKGTLNRHGTGSHPESTEEAAAAPFRTVRIRRDPPESERTGELRYWCSRFHDLGLAPVFRGRSLGNLSFRVREGENAFIITASGLALKQDLPVEAFVSVYGTADGGKAVLAGGTGDPSTESLLHFHVYEARREVMAIFHGHSREILKKADPLGLPATETAEPFGSMELVRSVLRVLGNHSFLILRKHGFLSLGRTMREAGEQAEAVLKSAGNLEERMPEET
jgi:L-fuculose-phosphate aldolase